MGLSADGSGVSAQRKCPKCESQLPASVVICRCGERVGAIPLVESTTAEARPIRSPIRLGILAAVSLGAAGLIAGTYWIANARSELNRAVAEIDKRERGVVTDCVSAYGVSLTLTETYTPSRSNRPMPMYPNQDGRTFTVVRGMARNDCGDSIQRANLLIEVDGEDGSQGVAMVPVLGLEPGESKPFEQTFIGHASSFKVLTAMR